MELPKEVGVENNKAFATAPTVPLEAVATAILINYPH
jgi:hypothetical protein